MLICLERGANDLHLASILALVFAAIRSHYHPIISRSSKIQNGLPFWCWLTQLVLEKKAVKWMQHVIVVCIHRYVHKDSHTNKGSAITLPCTISMVNYFTEAKCRTQLNFTNIWPMLQLNVT